MCWQNSLEMFCSLSSTSANDPGYYVIELCICTGAAACISSKTGACHFHGIDRIVPVKIEKVGETYICAENFNCISCKRFQII